MQIALGFRWMYKGRIIRRAVAGRHRAMKSGSEADVRQGIQQILDRLSPGHFICTERKTLRGRSAIGKPVDLQISFSDDLNNGLIAIEVANVNTTQLVGEACRLYYDCCPLKLMILG